MCSMVHSFGRTACTPRQPELAIIQAAMLWMDMKAEVEGQP